MPKSYMFAWNDKKRILIAENEELAKEKFQETFGFYPKSENTIIEEVK